MTLLEFCQRHDTIVIYGAGLIGQSVMKRLLEAKVEVASFVVSETPSVDAIDGIPVQQFSHWSPRTNKSEGILIAVSDRYREEILRILHQSGWGNAFTVDDSALLEFEREIHPISLVKMFQSVNPVSRIFGLDRGTPVDRYYIDCFLSHHFMNVSVGERHSLEVGEDTYSKRYFPGWRHEVLNYSEGVDLTKIQTLKANNYDVFICTQVFNFIYDVKAAIAGAYYLLKLGGTLLATVGGRNFPCQSVRYGTMGTLLGVY